jgi:hypothetical protein
MHHVPRTYSKLLTALSIVMRAVTETALPAVTSVTDGYDTNMPFDRLAAGPAE